jgi:hypothetical protein
MVDKAEWTRRYRAELKRRRAHLSETDLDILTGDEVYADLSARYSDEPEQAIDQEVNDWDKEDAARLRL